MRSYTSSSPWACPPSDMGPRSSWDCVRMSSALDSSTETPRIIRSDLVLSRFILSNTLCEDPTAALNRRKSLCVLLAEDCRDRSSSGCCGLAAWRKRGSTRVGGGLDVAGSSDCLEPCPKETTRMEHMRV